MNTRKYRPLIAAIPLMVSMLACSLGSAPQPAETQAPVNPNGSSSEATPVPESIPSEVPATSTEVASACDNPYMPIIVGATWNYKLTGPVPDTYTHTILSVEPNGFSEQDVFNVGVTRQGQWICENGNLIALNPPSGSSSTVQSENTQVDFETTEKSGITLPAQIQPNDTWSQSLKLEGTETIVGETYPASNQVTNDCKAIGIESVTVEAGTFDAMRVECQTVMNITVTMNGNDMNASINLTGITWYAEAIGIVKNQTTGMGLDSVTELVSYNIPQ